MSNKTLLKEMTKIIFENTFSLRFIPFDTITKFLLAGNKENHSDKKKPCYLQ